MDYADKQAEHDEKFSFDNINEKTSDEIESMSREAQEFSEDQIKEDIAPEKELFENEADVTEDTTPSPDSTLSDDSTVTNENIEQVPRDQIQQLATCEYITDHHNIIIFSAAGMGKTYLACALGIAACQQYYTVKYVRLPELLTEFAVARGQGVFQKVLSQYKKVSLLILDEWMLVSLQETEARDILEIVNARHKRASTIFCSQFSPAGWHGKIGEATLADAILDIIIHDSYQIMIQSSGDDFSVRELYGIKKNM